jgi:hypothetical protein
MENKVETSFKITRFPMTALVCDYLVEISARSNGMPVGEKVTMAELIAYAKCEILRGGHEGYTITQINEYHLIVDRRQQPALEIIEVEVFDIPDIIDDYGHSSN